MGLKSRIVSMNEDCVLDKKEMCRLTAKDFVFSKFCFFE